MSKYKHYELDTNTSINLNEVTAIKKVITEGRYSCSCCRSTCGCQNKTFISARNELLIFMNNGEKFTQECGSMIHERFKEILKLLK